MKSFLKLSHSKIPEPKYPAENKKTTESIEDGHAISNEQIIRSSVNEPFKCFDFNENLFEF